MWVQPENDEADLTEAPLADEDSGASGRGPWGHHLPLGFGEPAPFFFLVKGRQSCYTVDSYSICTMRRCLWPCRLQPMRLGDCGRTVVPSVRSSRAGTARRSVTAAGVRPPPPASPAAQLTLRRRAPPVSSSEVAVDRQLRLLLQKLKLPVQDRSLPRWHVTAAISYKF